MLFGTAKSLRLGHVHPWHLQISLGAVPNYSFQGPGLIVVPGEVPQPTFELHFLGLIGINKAHFAKKFPHSFCLQNSCWWSVLITPSFHLVEEEVVRSS